MVAHSREDLILGVYAELREMAARLLRRERDNHTLQRTALVHETFIRLFGQCPEQLPAENFLALAARQMRRILIDYGRKHNSQKRGGGAVRALFPEPGQAGGLDGDLLLALDQALERLGQADPRALSVVELKFFGGYTGDETARILGVSDGTVEADWQFARSWLFGALTDRSSQYQA